MNALIHRTENTIPLTIPAREVCLLNQQLADAIDLQLQAKQAFWSTCDTSFITFHFLCSHVAEEMGRSADGLAERASELGRAVRGTIQSVLATSRLPVYPLQSISSDEHMVALGLAIATFAVSANSASAIAADNRDFATANVLSQVSRSSKKLFRMLESQFQNQLPRIAQHSVADTSPDDAEAEVEWEWMCAGGTLAEYPGFA
jgi:starvation-inducible DNA-binding protein